MNELLGFSARIFVPDGDPEGLRVIEKSNWTGQGIVFPRSLFAEVRHREDASQTRRVVRRAGDPGQARIRVERRSLRAGRARGATCGRRIATELRCHAGAGAGTDTNSSVQPDGHRDIGIGDQAALAGQLNERGQVHSGRASPQEARFKKSAPLEPTRPLRASRDSRRVPRIRAAFVLATLRATPPIRMRPARRH